MQPSTMSASKTNQTSNMSFVDVARSMGVKGADVWANTGSALVDYSVSAVRGADSKSLCKILAVVDGKKGTEDAFVMTFHVRNIRGG